MFSTILKNHKIPRSWPPMGAHEIPREYGGQKTRLKRPFEFERRGDNTVHEIFKFFSPQMELSIRFGHECFDI